MLVDKVNYYSNSALRMNPCLDSKLTAYSFVDLFASGNKSLPELYVLNTGRFCIPVLIAAKSSEARNKYCGN